MMFRNNLFPRMFLIPAKRQLFQQKKIFNRYKNSKSFSTISEGDPTPKETPSLDLVVDASHASGHVLCLGLSRPQARNALSRSLMSQMESVLESLSQQDCAVRSVLIHSLVPGVFCAGADLKERATMTEAEVGPFVSSARELLNDVSRLPMPTICALDGIALGGGLELALACDLRVGATNVLLGLVETRLGILPGAGGTQRLPRLIGASRAKELIFTGRRVTGEEAFNFGLLNELVAQNEAGNAAFIRGLALATQLATESGPLALRWAKVAIDQGLEKPLITDALDIEDVCYSQIIQTNDRLEGIQAFLQKRPPKFAGN